MDDREFPEGWPWPKNGWGLLFALLWVIGFLVMVALRRGCN